MENAFSIIERCCDQVEAQGIQIVRGPLFDWTGPGGWNVPKACDGLGAVLWCNGGRAEKPWTALRKLLRVDEFWLYRFCIGCDADTTAAITGALAGSYYGYDGIPERWRAVVDRGYYLHKLDTRLFQPVA